MVLILANLKEKKLNKLINSSKKGTRLVLLIGLFVVSLSALADERHHVFGQTIDTHMIKSKYVDQTFEIHVMLPLTYKGVERLPVLYATDADSVFGAFSSIADSMIAGGVVPPFILVGIGYPGDEEHLTGPFSECVICLIGQKQT